MALLGHSPLGLPSFPEVGQNSMWISTDAAASVLEPLKVVWAKCSGYPSYPALVSRALWVGPALLGPGIQCAACALPCGACLCCWGCVAGGVRLSWREAGV